MSTSNLIRFWQAFQRTPEAVKAAAIAILDRHMPSEVKNILRDVTSPERFYLKNRLALLGKTLGETLKLYEKRDGIYFINRTDHRGGKNARVFPEKFQLPLSEFPKLNWLRFLHRDVFESLDIFEKCFAFLDPPYMNCSKMYKDSDFEARQARGCVASQTKLGLVLWRQGCGARATAL